MKKIYTKLALSLSVFISIQTSAQCASEIYGVCPIGYTGNTTNAGGGMGFGYFSKPFHIVPISSKNKTNEMFYGPLNFQFGGNMYFGYMGGKTFKDVPLVAPESGNAKVSFDNWLTSINPSVRLTSSMFDGKVMPYAEVFAGWRHTSSSLAVTPNDYSQKGTDSTIHSSHAINVGVAGGVMFEITKGVRLDVGALWSHSEVMGSSVDINSIHRDGDAIDVTSVDSPFDYVIIKAGISFDIDGSNGGSGSGSGYVGGGHSYHGHGNWLNSLGHCLGGGHGGGGHVNIHFH
jgi:hypothetical protein